MEWQWIQRGRSDAESQVRRWLAGRLGGTSEALPLQRDPHGRPRLGAPLAGYDLSWSHSGDGLLMAWANGQRIGVDCEQLRPRPRAMEIARRYFTDAETGWLAAHHDDARDAAFLRLWCAKEAVLKAHGRGLAFGLDRLEFAERDSALQLRSCDSALGPAGAWTLRELVPTRGVIAALASIDATMLPALAT